MLFFLFKDIALSFHARLAACRLFISAFPLAIFKLWLLWGDSMPWRQSLCLSVRAYKSGAAEGLGSKKGRKRKQAKCRINFMLPKAMLVLWWIRTRQGIPSVYLACTSNQQIKEELPRITALQVFKGKSNVWKCRERKQHKISLKGTERNQHESKYLD